MYTLDKKEQKREKKHMKKISFRYLMGALFCIVFAVIYESFSHQVYSGYMIFAFALPLVGGALPYLLITLLAGQQSTYIIQELQH